MDKTQLVERVKKKLDAYVGVKITALEPQYESDWRPIFDDAKAAGALLTGDELGAALNDRWPDDMKDDRYANLFVQGKKLWDEWIANI